MTILVSGHEMPPDGYKMWRLAGPEPTDANNHQIAHHFAGDAGGRGRPGDDFPIASVDGQQDTRNGEILLA